MSYVKFGFRIPEQFKVNTKDQMLAIIDAEDADTCVVVKEHYDTYFRRAGKWLSSAELAQKIEETLAGANNR